MEVVAKRQMTSWLRIAIILLIIGIVIFVGLLVRTVIMSGQEAAPRTAMERELLDARTAVETDPKSGTARLELGRVYAELGKYKEAVTELEEAKKLDPRNREIPYTLGMVYKSQGNTNAAIRELNSAIKLHNAQNATKFSEAYFELGLIYYEKENYKKALPAFEKAEEGSPQAADMLLYLGLTYEKLGKKKEAVAVLDYVTQLLPDSKEAQEALTRLKKE
jgi:tetratricopeptide (TPR) repeat protein